MKAIIPLIGILTWTFSPHIAFAQTQNTQNQNQAIVSEDNDPLHLADIILGDGLPRLEEIIAKTLQQRKEIVEAPEPVDPRIELMKQYLQSKKSPLEPYAEELLNQYHYRLILGISFAESNFCKRNIKPHNCWGIGGGRPEAYVDYPAAVTRANDLIQKYFDSGLVNPKLMRNRWVGWQNNNWIIAVEQVTRDLEKKGL